MIRNSQENFKNQRQKMDDENEKAQSELDAANGEYIPAFGDSELPVEYKNQAISLAKQPMLLANVQVPSNKQPFAVPPTDYRYYEKGWYRFSYLFVSLARNYLPTRM